MRINEKLVVSTVSLGLFAAAASLAVSPPANWNDSSLAFHYPLAADLLMAVLHMGAALLFILSLSVYKAKFRTAFWGIVVGILLIGIGTVQLPIIDALDMWTSKYVESGIIALPFLISGFALFWGASGFGKLIGEKGLIVRRLVIILVAIGLAGVSTILPHVHKTIAESTYDVTNSLYIWILVLELTAAIIFLRIRQRIGVHYKVAMTWLAIALLCSATCVVLATMDNYLSSDIRGIYMQLLNFMVVVSGFAWLKAGYTFTTTKEY